MWDPLHCCEGQPLTVGGLTFLRRAMSVGVRQATPACRRAIVQALGQQSEYMRATTAKGSQGGASSASDSRAEVSKLIADKQQLQKELDQATAEAAAAAKNLAAVKTQAQVRGVGGACCAVWCAVVQCSSRRRPLTVMWCLLPAPACRV